MGQFIMRHTAAESPDTGSSGCFRGSPVERGAVMAAGAPFSCPAFSNRFAASKTSKHLSHTRTCMKSVVRMKASPECAHDIATTFCCMVNFSRSCRLLEQELQNRPPLCVINNVTNFSIFIFKICPFLMPRTYHNLQ